ncbi:hydrolase [Bacillus benzoevorans]|uniref:Pimeloyl-ACP methyl ester carboxylesterase n=1 Tax=Bacillus benzoevorans TaxID=1456 RepID=A0A7X0HMS8_9BACI|nr:hydrolase [Bacillus benzoevorans]MBB6443538.1 pimeloyl-ACP methyl ester carboxylesterase [Bacillus benzoevorans]
MKSRNFRLDTEWNIIHYPEKPQGFGILIIGDERHFVDENTSFWLQNEGKKILINNLREAGYTIFYSNLFGRNWGSDNAAKMTKRLYEYVMRMEILNEKVHIIAEGMGALVALKLLEEMKSSIRSCFLINPIFSLKHHLELEKDRKFFYKRLVKELEQSYEMKVQELMSKLKETDDYPCISTAVPMKIIHVLAGNRGYKQSRFLNELSAKWEDAKKPFSVCYMVPEKKQQISQQMIRFFKAHEDI